MEESEDNISAEDIKDTDLFSFKVKPKKRSMVERELETSLTARITSPRTSGDSSSTSRYGRARRLTVNSETEKTKPLKSPKIEGLITLKSPVYKMHASNSPIKVESPSKNNLQCKLEHQIENIYNENISLSRFGSAEKKQVSPTGKTPKVYVRKDLIQNKEREETVTLIQNMFSPIKSNTHLKNVLERSSDKFDLSGTKKKSYLDNSSVVKTLDFDGKKKRKDKDAKQPISQSDLEAQCEYQAGDLAWARMGTYPYWPCIVTKDPVSGTFVKKKLFGRVHHDVIHVTFFGDNGRRSWIVDNMLRKFKGQMEFECARETFTPEARKKDPRYAAFIVSEKKLPQWSISVEEAERLVREPKRLRTEILNDMLQKSRSYKTTPKGCKKTSRTNSDVSFSESLYGTLFLEDDSKAQDTERSKSKTRKNSRDMSEVVTACIDNMAAKTGITKIQKQSHMDRWLEKAKSKTPEKTQLKSRISTPKTKLSVKKNKAVKSNDSKKPFRFIINDNDNESLDGSDNKLQSYHNEHDYSNQYCISSPVIDVDDSLNELPEITSSGIGIIAKDEGLSGVHNSNSTQDDLEVLTEHVETGDIIVEPEDYLQDAISETTSQNDYENIKRDIQMEIDDEINTIHDNNLITSHKTTRFQDKELKIKKNNSNKDLHKISLKVFNNSGSNENNAEIDNKDEDGSEFKKSKKLLKTAVNVFTNEETINSSMEWSINCEDEVTTATVEKKSNNLIKNSYDESSKSNKTDFLGELNNVSNCKNAVKDNPEYKGNKTSKIDLKEGEDMIVIDDSDTDSLKSVYKTEKIDKKNSDRNKLCKEDKIDQSKVPGNENDANLELPMPNIFLYNSAHVPEDECVCPVIYPNNIEEASITDASKSVIDSPIPIDEVVDSPNKIEQYSLIDVQYGDVDWNLQGIENEKMSQGATGKTKSKCISADIYLNTDINKNTERNSILDITKEKNMGHSFGELDKLSSKNSTSTTSDCDNDNLDEPTENSGVENVDEFISDISVPNGYRQSVLDILDSKCKGKNYEESNNSSTSVSVDKITDGDFSNRKSSEGTIDVTKVDKCVSADINRNAESNRIFGVTKEKSVGPLFRTFRKDNSSSKNSNYTTSDCDNDNLDEPTESSGTENVDESTSDISTLNGSHQSVVNSLDVKSPIINDEDSINSTITMNGAKISQSDFENATKNVEKLHHTNNVSEITNADDSSNIITDREKAKYASNSMACDNKGLIERTVCRMDIELNYPETSFQNKLNKQIKNIANSESSDKFSNVTSNNNTKLSERNSKNTIVEEIKGCNLIDKNKETDADTASTVSTESEMSLSLRRQRWRAEKQKPTEEKAALVGGMEDPEFLKYVELKQDAIYDEHPELSQEDITVYLYNTWKYEESLKTDVQKTDDLDHANLPKGLQIEPAQPRKARRRANKLDVDKTDVTVKQEVPKQKTKRKTSKPYYNEELYDLDDDDDDIEYFEIFRNKKQGGKTGKAQTADGQALSAEEDDTEEVDEVEEYFAQLIRPKPNVFRGLLRERVCEICEMTGNLVKCKGCHCMFHVDCVKKEVAVVELPAPMKGRKKKKKLKGRKSKSDENFDESNSDDKSRDTNVSEDANTSIENDMESNIVANVDDFEAQLAIKMKELLGDEQNVQYDSVSSEDELDWSDTEAGKCEVVDIKLKQKKLNHADYSDFKCNNCQKYDEPVCFVCRSPVSPKTKAHHRQRCQVPQCNKYFHLECLEHWPQTQFNSGETARYNKKVNEYFEALSCPRHVCHTCVSDDPRGCKTRFSGDKLAKCVRCPATYHSFTKCLPAGTQILTGSHIICPRHYEHRPGKVPCHVNTGWCFICALGGTLICCEYCPTSFHAECLNIKPPEGGYMCEDCETGRLPLYGEMVWVKLGHYRWWPGIILHPSEIPENIFAVKHSPGEFVVRFFGQYDHYWVNRGRVFPFQEGDSGKVSSQRSKIDAAFTMAMEHAQRACEILKAATPNEEESLDIASSLLPPHYVKLRVNKPCGSLVGRRTDAEEGSLTQCECSPSDDEPCGPYSQCLNRMLLTECGPTCRAGDRCNNRAFEKRLYPKLVPYRTPHRGWGLKTLEDIKAGQFVIEYVGELIDEAEFERRMRRKHDIRDENFYFLTLDKERMIDAGPKGNLARFMNHCCEPNCETQKWTVLGDVRVGLFALYDIPANSEVTFNYNLESTGVEKKRCMCGAKRCSGYIGAKPKQSEPQKKPKVAPVKRSYKKRKIEDSPTTSKPKPKLKQGRPIKPRELTEIEKDLLIIKNATNGLSSDSECSDRLSSIESCSRASKRRRVGFSTEEMSSNCSSPSTSKRLRLEKCSDIYE